MIDKYVPRAWKSDPIIILNLFTQTAAGVWGLNIQGLSERRFGTLIGVSVERGLIDPFLIADIYDDTRSTPITHCFDGWAFWFSSSNVVLSLLVYMTCSLQLEILKSAVVGVDYASVVLARLSTFDVTKMSALTLMTSWLAII